MFLPPAKLIGQIRGFDMSIHVTPIPRLTSFGTPAFTLGTTNSAGDSDIAVASNSTLLAFDATVPATIGTSAAAGSAAVAPHRDHVHSGVALITSVDNEIARYTGTGGQLQGYTSGAPTISDTGAMLKPGQPAFLAYLNANQSNATGNGTTVQVNFNAEVYDQTNNFASSAFTAPVTGKYLLSASIYMDDRTTSATQVVIEITTSNRRYIRQDGLGAGTSGFGIAMTTVADMDATDTAVIKVMVAGEAGDTIDILGNGTLMHTFFAGALLA